MSDIENLQKIADLSKAALDLAKELDDAQAKVRAAEADAEAIQAQLVEVKRALCGLVASTVEFDLEQVIDLQGQE